MRKYVCTSNIIISLFLLTLCSCDSKFILDPIDPRLPKYTEDGNNVAGAFVNQDVWKSVVKYGFMNTYNKPYITVYSANDSVVLSLDGDIEKENNVILSTNISFCLQNLNIYSFSDLKNLKNRIVQLDGVENFGSFARYTNLSDYPRCSGTAGTGQIYFRNVTVNDSNGSAILSGSFGFTIANSDCGLVEVSYGRFDYRFQNNSNFMIK